MLKKLLCLASLYLTPILLAAVGTTPISAAEAPAGTAKEVVAAAIAAETPDAQKEAILSMRANPTPEIVTLLEQWKNGEIFIHTTAAGKVTAIVPGQPDAEGNLTATLFATGAPYTDAEGKPVVLKKDSDEVTAAETTGSLRRAMKDISDLAALSDPDWRRRLAAATDSAIGQNPDKLPGLRARMELEKDSDVLRALKTSIARIQLKSADRAEKIAACKQLGELGSLAAPDGLKEVLKQAEAAGDKELAAAAKSALAAIDRHLATIDAVGTGFRGLSLGSVLLVVAIGLAITFGLMGVINMAHGEFIAIGAYTTYLMQFIFTTGIKLSPFGLSLAIPGLGIKGGESSYFIFAIPASFLVAAGIGILLERSVIQFLYKRPLESLLATWGISLVIQQILKFIFGSNNVQVASPIWLSGNWTLNDVVFTWNRVFVIGFAVLIIVLTWLLLNKTSLGLLIRAVMQNRNMAACMGVRTERVNTMTFAFGCGLAGLAGAFLSQIGNVGPSMGQLYIVDSFMTVVVGGVGNILGTVISALGIGMADQTLQQYLGNPVIGKILVLGFIILFLQWRPAGLFVTRSRSLD